jgi:integrase
LSIQKRKRKGGSAWRVLWRDERGTQRSRTFNLKRDAEAWEAKIKLAKRQGELAGLDAGRQTLRAFADDWWRLYAEPVLAPKTRELYVSLRDRHLLPRLGHLQLRALSPERVQSFQVDLAAEGVGRETIRKTLALLQGMLERAVEWGRIPRNPVKSVKKPPQGRLKTIRPLSPSQVERLRREMLRRGWIRDATLVSVLAYAGLRPGEALALRWADMREQTIVVDKAVSLGEEKATKTRSKRTVRLFAPLAADLAEWRMASGRPSGTALVFPTAEGDLWTDSHYRNWRGRRYKRAAAAVGLSGARPYDLRHSLASLLLAEQMNPAEIANEMGHTLQTLFGTYAHVIEDLRGGELTSAEEEIRKARSAAVEADVAQMLPTPMNSLISPGAGLDKNLT